MRWLGTDVRLTKPVASPHCRERPHQLAGRSHGTGQTISSGISQGSPENQNQEAPCLEELAPVTLGAEEAETAGLAGGAGKGEAGP